MTVALVSIMLISFATASAALSSCQKLSRPLAIRMKMMISAFVLSSSSVKDRTAEQNSKMMIGLLN